MKALKLLRNEIISLQLFQQETNFDNFVIEMDVSSEKDMVLFESLRDREIEIKHSVHQCFRNIAVYGDVSLLQLKNFTIEKIMTYSLTEVELYAKIRNNDSEDSYIAVLTIDDSGELKIRRMLRKLGE